MSENFAELLEESLKRSVMKPGAVIQAEVIGVGGDFVTVTAPGFITDRFKLSSRSSAKFSDMLFEFLQSTFVFCTSFVNHAPRSSCRPIAPLPIPASASSSSPLTRYSRTDTPVQSRSRKRMLNNLSPSSTMSPIPRRDVSITFSDMLLELY
jgi:hypothetical protein